MEAEIEHSEQLKIDPEEMDRARGFVSSLSEVLMLAYPNDEQNRRVLSQRVEALNKATQEFQSKKLRGMLWTIWENARLLVQTMESVEKTPYPPKITGMVASVRHMLSIKAQLKYEEQGRLAKVAMENYGEALKRVEASIKLFKEAEVE